MQWKKGNEKFRIQCILYVNIVNIYIYIYIYLYKYINKSYWVSSHSILHEYVNDHDLSNKVST